MKEETVATLIAGLIGVGGTLLGGVIGGVAAWLVARSTNNFQKQLAAENLRSQERAMIDALLIKMLEFLIEYPHLEKEEFCGSYPDVTGHPNGKERYEAYCIFVFNMLTRAFKHFGEDAQKLGEYIALDEILECHHKWWHHDKRNFEYDEPFRQCIQGVVDRLRKAGKIS